MDKAKGKREGGRNNEAESRELMTSEKEEMKREEGKERRAQCTSPCHSQLLACAIDR